MNDERYDLMRDINQKNDHFKNRDAMTVVNGKKSKDKTSGENLEYNAETLRSDRDYEPESKLKSADSEERVQSNTKHVRNINFNGKETNSRYGSGLNTYGEKTAEDDENDDEIPSGHDNSAKLLLLIPLGVIIFVIAVFVIVRISHRTFNSVKVLKKEEIQYNTNADYIEFGTNLIKYTPEGVSYINSSGKTVWTKGTDFRVPIAEAKGNYAVVADKGGNTVIVFDENGVVSTKQMPYTICDIDITSSGDYSAILENDKTNYIEMFDRNGEIIYEMQTSINKSGYPMDVAISEDGKKLFTSYFRLDGINIKNNVTAYNFGSVGQNENADRMVGGFSFNTDMVPKVNFLTNDIAAAFADDKIVIYDMKEKPSERATIKLENEATAIFYSDSYVGTISKAVSGDNSNGYVMKTYDFSGNEIFSYDFNFDFEKIYADSEEIILTGSDKCLIVTAKGKTKLTYAFPSMVKSMVPTSVKNEYVVTLKEATEVVRLINDNK